MTIFSFFYRVLRKLKFLIDTKFFWFVSYIKLNGNGVHFDKTLICNGVPIIDVHKTGTFKIGSHCTINSGVDYNPIGRYSPCFFLVRERAKLTIGNNTGISSSAIVCHKEIIIGSFVKFGGNVVIYDTDFHAIDANTRRNIMTDKPATVSKSVIIEDDVFVGAHSTILKGVRIGQGSIIGAGSMVTRNVPANEIWGGNPAEFIKKIEI